MANNICCIFNLAPHYRQPIYSLMDIQLKCDFYFGNSLGNQIKLLDYQSLEGFRGIVKNIKLKKYGFMWQAGVWKLIFKPYRHYIITGDPGILSNWFILIIAKLLGKKVYAWTHGLKKPVVTKGNQFQKLFYRLCYKIFLYGDYSRNVMLNEGFIETKLIPIYNSLDHDKQIIIRNQIKKSNIFINHFNNNNPTLIYVGRIQKSKKLDLLIKALHKLAMSDIVCNLVIVGSEVDSTSRIPELVNKFNLNKRVWFYGPCYDEKKIGNLFHNADVCISPGPVGLTALHALTFGCPVISNDDFMNQMPEHEVIIPGATGDFFKNDNIQNLTDTIKKWINLPFDNRNEIRKKAYNVIKDKWNPNYQISVLKEIFK